ncbi:MAG: sensor histidine kinase [Persicimonas sp.]
MKLAVRTKLVLASVALAAVVAVAGGLYLEDVQATVFATLTSLVAALSMSWLASSLLKRRLGKLVSHTRDISRGEHDEKLLVAHDEKMLSGVAGSMVQLSEELSETVDALAKERNRFEAVLENMSEAVVAVDADHRITLVNRAAVELLELDVDPGGRPVVEVLRAPGLQTLLDAAEQGQRSSQEFDISATPPKRVLAQASPPQETVGVVVVMHDVTELRHLETMRRDFVANVSHELRTPVTIIRATAETLQEGAINEPEHAERFLDALIRNSQRLSRLISDLLDISRIEAGEYAIDLMDVALRDAVLRTTETVESQADDRHIEVTVDVDSDLCVQADKGALEQVMLNLIGNAVKYTGDGGRVEVRARADDGRVRIEVEDNGPGIATQHRDRIFERFYRVDSGRSREIGGTGLGLSIVKHLVTTMGGEVGYRPAKPRGSVFWFELSGC